MHTTHIGLLRPLRDLCDEVTADSIDEPTSSDDKEFWGGSDSPSIEPGLTGEEASEGDCLPGTGAPAVGGRPPPCSELDLCTSRGNCGLCGTESRFTPGDPATVFAVGLGCTCAAAGVSNKPSVAACSRGWGDVGTLQLTVELRLGSAKYSDSIPPASR